MRDPKQLIVLTLAAATLAVAQPARSAVIAFFDSDSYVDQAQEATHLRNSLTNLGHTVNQFTTVSEAAFDAALTGADALVISEMQNGDLYADMDQNTRDLVTDYVRSGGDIIITARIDRASSMINGLFGKSVTAGSSGNSNLDADAALGTSFEGGPASLPAPSAVQGASIPSLPSFALPIYTYGGDSTTVFVFPEDAGSVIWLGFDWYATPTDADWEDVLGRAVDFESNVWDGSSSGTWSTGDNWSSASAPAANERVVFAGSTNTTVNHDNAAGTDYAAITFASNAAAFTITGNAIGITDGGNITNRSSNTQTFDADLDLDDADATASADTAGFDFNGDIALGGTSTLTIDGSEDTTIDGAVSGTGALAKTGSGTLTLTATNSYTGGTTVSAGTLVGDTDSIRGDLANNGAVTFSQASDATFAGNITGTGSLTKSGAGTLTLTGTNTWSGATTLSAGGLVLSDADAGPAGSVTVTGGTLSGASTIGGGLTGDGGHIAPGASIGTLTVGGTFTLDGSTLHVELDNAGNADKIVANAATLTSGTVRAEPEELITAERTYTIIETTAGIGGDPANLSKAISNSSYLLDFELQVNGNNLELVASPGAAFGDAASDSTGQNIPGIADVMDEALAAGRGGAEMTALQGMTEPQIDQVMAQSQPQIYQATAQIVRVQHQASKANWLSNTQSVRAGVRQADRQRRRYRLADADGSSLAAALAADATADQGQLEPGQWVGWGRYVGDVGSVDGDAFAAGYGYATHGADAGVQTLLDSFVDVDQHILVGAGVSALWSEVDGEQASGSSQSTSLYANVYATWFNPSWHIDGGLSYGHAWTDTHRPITAMGLIAEGDYQSDIYSGFVGGGYVFDVKGWDIEPFAQFDYTHTRDQGYTETGAGGLNLTMGDNGSDSLRHTLGVRASKAFELNNGMTVKPRASAAWGYEYLDTQVVNDIGLLGSSFRNRGVDISRSTAVMSAGLDWDIRDRITAFADYTATVNDDRDSHFISLGLAVRF